MNGTASDIEKIFDARIEDIAAMLAATSALSSSEMTMSSREILVVENAVYSSAGYRANGPNGRIGSEAYVQLTGSPTPNSSVTNGYIRFVPRSEVSVPRWNANRKQIQVSVDLDYMAQTLEQLRHPNRYLWIGFFSGGHVYSDLHSTL